MSILGSILGRVFGRKVDADEARAAGRAQAQTQPQTQARPQTTNTGGAAYPTGGMPGAQPTGATGGHPSAAGAQPVDVEAMLTALDASTPGASNWRTSIVDLMKLLAIDPSLDNRKELARELGYTGDTGDSATMNVWLHRQVMNTLARNGGVVPASMRD